jgi:hypothetical protein
MSAVSFHVMNGRRRNEKELKLRCETIKGAGQIFGQKVIVLLKIKNLSWFSNFQNVPR